MTAENASMGNAIAAFYLSRSSSGTGFSMMDANGYLGLLDKEGSVRLLQTSGMDVGGVDWNESGLVFADTENDYHLADMLTTIASPKVNLQAALFATAGGGSVGVYNDGYDDDGGYTEHVVTVTEGRSQSRAVEGYYTVLGLCGETIYGLTEPSGPYLQKAESEGHSVMGEYGFRTLVLTQLNGTARGAEQPVSFQSVDESNQTSSDAPCSGGVLHHLSTVYQEDGATSLAYRAWNVETGEVTQRPITVTAGTRELTETYIGYEDGGYGRQSLRGDYFDFVTADGRVMSTNTSTGDTKELFTLADSGMEVGEFDRAITFTPSTLATMTASAEASTATYIEYNRLTGEVLRTHHLPDITRLVSSGLTLRSLATRPD